MPDRLIITEENQLKEVSIPETPQQPLLIKWLATIISYLFHPLFIPIYLTYLIIEIRSYQFAFINPSDRRLLMLLVIISCSLIPLVSILLLRALNFIDSIYLKTQKERVVPYIICMTFYFSVWFYFKKNHYQPDLVSMALGIFNASVAAFLINIVMKVSMHAVAMGVMTTFVALLAFTDSSSYSLYLAVAVLLSGIVCTSRLIVSDHSSREIYYGFVAGVVSQLAAHYFVYS
jgi:hypothetical protein